MTSKRKEYPCNHPSRGRVPFRPGGKKFKYSTKLVYKGRTWRDVSKQVRKRDGRCLKCGSLSDLQADHFHPRCYMWLKDFFNPRFCQTLCGACHKQMPRPRAHKKEEWIKFCFVKN